jgi:hypothetical protein
VGTARFFTKAESTPPWLDVAVAAWVEDSFKASKFACNGRRWHWHASAVCCETPAEPERMPMETLSDKRYVISQRLTPQLTLPGMHP